MSKPQHRQREQDEDGLDYVKVALGLVFVFGAFVFAFIAPPGTLVVSFGLMLPAGALLAGAIQDATRRRRAISPPIEKERQLLSAIRDNGGSITPAEAAMETSLTVKEADRMLSELAGGGGTSPWRARVGRCTIRSTANGRLSSTTPAPQPDAIRPRLLASLAFPRGLTIGHPPWTRPWVCAVRRLS